MLQNYFKLALRNLRKNKIYSTINLLGLAFGLADSIAFLHQGQIISHTDRESFRHSPLEPIQQFIKGQPENYEGEID